MPWLIEELDGAAEGADVDPLALFACSVEEIWYEPRTPGAGAAIDGRCSDVVASSPATADGHVLVGHNNDLSPRYRDELVAIERRVPGDPAILTIGNGIWISVGMERCRAVAHGQRAVAERRAGRHPARAAGARDAP